MLTRIREVRKVKGLTLQEVADRCDPPTTAQTIGRLETGMRTVSVPWLNRIAAALGVDPSELVTLPDRSDLPVAAVLGPDGAVAPRRETALTPPQPGGAMIGLIVESTQGDYRAGDSVWLEKLWPEDFGRALNRDVLVPRPVGRFAFGRLAATAPDAQGARVNLLPLTPGARQLVIPDVPWIAVARLIVRTL